MKLIEEKHKSYAYDKKERREGYGQIRIGTNLKPKLDLYSMLFVATFHAEYIHDLYENKNKR